MSKDAEPDPRTTAARNTAVGTPEAEQDLTDLLARAQVRGQVLAVG